MFISLNDNLQQLWLFDLLVLWAGLLFGGFIFGRYQLAAQRRMPVWTRMGSSAALAVAAWSWAVFTAQGELIAPVTIWLAVGMTLGWIGDLALAGVLTDWLQIKAGFLTGMIAFALGHVMYIVGLLMLASLLGLMSGQAFVLGLGIWGAIGIIGWIAVAGRAQGQRTLRLLALPYALLLCATAGCATALAIQSPYFIPVAVGAVLFVFSDLLVAGEHFSGWRFPLLGDVIWLTYGPAQALIVFSAEFALRYLAR